MSTILVDMDSIIADFYFGILDLHERETGEKLPHDHVDAWDKTLSGVSMYHYFSQPGFFAELRPIPGAHDVLRRLHDAGHEIVIVSSIAGMGHAPGEKLPWLKRYYPWIKDQRVIFAKEKYRIKGDVLIDDHPVNCAEFKKAQHSSLTIGIEYPYNRLTPECFDVLVPGYTDFEGAWKYIGEVVEEHLQLLSELRLLAGEK